MGQSGRGLRGARGNEGGDDVKKQVDSDDSHQRPIYQLVNVKNGGGKLVELVKSRVRSSAGSLDSQARARRQRDLSADEELEAEIRRLVEPLLYERGRGKLVPLAELWAARLGTPAAQAEGRAGPGPRATGGRWVCWRLDERGFVGETALHICFLLSTQTHMTIARKLLSMFPALVNDLYTSDEYFGESVLHMAIVNEDVRIVKLLLSHGADVHERCLGSFFMPLDQKERANAAVRRHLELAGAEPLDLRANHYSSELTDYEGYAYWGEYPLSFAVCLGLADCYKLLLAGGADPNRADSNGNTSLHMAVIADKQLMFDLCYSTGADLRAANRQHLTPLALAAKLRRTQMFFHILTMMRRVDWVFCGVGFAGFPLEGVDSVDTASGRADDHSALAIVVFGASNEHLEMLDGLLAQLLLVKWDTFVRGRFNAWLRWFLAVMCVALVAYTTRLQLGRAPHSPLLGQAQLCSELALVACALHYLASTCYRLAPALGVGATVGALARAPELLVFAGTCLLVLGCVPLRLCGLRGAEELLASLVMFSLPLKLLFFCRASGSVGSFVVMIYRILVNDVLCFVVFLVIFVAGFSQSFLVIFRSRASASEPPPGDSPARDYFANAFDGLLAMHMMALNEFTSVLDQFRRTAYPELARALFCAYMVLVAILLMNMLIAMLGKTFQDIASQPNESLRQWARALLMVERLLGAGQRLAMLDRYSHADARGRRCYRATWRLAGRDLEEIAALDRLERDNRRSRSRLQQPPPPPPPQEEVAG